MPKYTTKEHWIRVTGFEPNSQATPVSNENRTRYKTLTLPKLEDGVKNKSLVGIWQACQAVKGSSGNYQITSGGGLKIISNDRTFRNIVMRAGTANSVITMKGNYEQFSDSIYVESIMYSLTPLFPAGVKNEIHVKFLHDNLIQLNFNLPDQGRHIDEYWVRVTTPIIEI